MDPTKTLSALTPTEKTTLCTWFIGTLGGERSQHTCGSLIYTVVSPSMCASNIVSAGPSCTVGAFQQWVAAQGSACGVFESTDATVCN